jgi:putative PEP-CTERM system TPR-repeat lipoprotein
MTSMFARKFCCVLTALLAAAMLTGCGRDEPSALIASAKAYIAKSDYKSGTIQLKSALQQAPDSAEARFLLGKSLLASGDPAAAQTEVRKALELKYPADEAYPLLARTLLAQGDFQKVVSELGERRLDGAQARGDLGTSVAIAYMALGEMKKARSALDAALAETPSDARALTVAAQLDAAGKDFAAASTHIDAALAASPNDPEATAIKAELEVSQGRRDEAIKILEHAVETDPNALSTRFALASLLITSGQVEKAAIQVDAMKKVTPQDLRTLYLEALVAFSRGDAAHAREAIQKVLGAKPDHLPSLYLSGLIDLRLGSLGAAEEQLRKVVAQAPNEASARRALATTYLRMGQTARAIDTVEPALARAPDDPATLRVAAEAYLASGNAGKASQDYERANAIDKGNVASEVRLAQVRIATGDTARAFKDLEALSEGDASQYQADLALISAHLRRGEFDQALAAANRLEKKQPANPLSYNVKGTVYAAKRDFKSARANFEKALEVDPKYFAAARNLALLDIQERKPEDARKRYEQMLAKDPKNEPLLLAYVELLMLTGQPPDAVKAAIDKAIVADPDSVSARLVLINYSMRRGDAKAALAAAQSAQAALPNDARILEAVGVTQLAAGDTNQALNSFQRLVQLQPQQPTPLLRLADAQIRAKDYPGTIETLRKALALQPDLSQAWIGLAKTYVVSGHPDDAIGEAHKLQKERPDRALGFAIEGEVLASQKKWPQAATTYREALSREPIPTLAVRRYGALLNAGEATEATHMADRWFQEHPKDLTLHMFIAVQSQMKKDYAAATAHYRAALAIEPDNATVLNNFAVVLSDAGDAKAVEYAQRAYQLAPYNPDVMDTFGWVLVQTHEATRGTELLRAAANLAPTNYEIRLHFAKALIQAGDKAGARRELETLAKLDKASPIRADAEKLLSGL